MWGVPKTTGRAEYEQGAAASEYVGIIVLAAGVFAVLFVALGPAGAEVRAATCRAVNTAIGGDLKCASGKASSSKSQAKTDSDYEPKKCKVSQGAKSSGSATRLGVVKVGGGSSAIETQYSDGTVTWTLAQDSVIGPEGGVGADFSWGDVEADARADVGADIKYKTGSTWTFKDKDEADKYQKQIKEYRNKEIARKNCGNECGPDQMKPPKDPMPPTITYEGTSLGAKAKGEVGLNSTGSKSLSKGDLSKRGVAGQVDGDWLITRNNKNTPDDASDDTYTSTTDLSVAADLTRSTGSSATGVGSVKGMSYAITRDSKDRVVEVKIVSSAEANVSESLKAKGEKKSGSAKASADDKLSHIEISETTLKVDPSNRRDQKTISDWVGGKGDFDYPGLVPLNAVDPARGDPKDPFGQLIHDRATSSSITYRDAEGAAAYGLNLKMGIAFGGDFTKASSNRSAIDAKFVGAPRSDGTRPKIDYTNCVP